MANQSVILQLKTGQTDDWGKDEYTKIPITNCVVQPQTIYSGDSNSRSIVANAIVYFYANVTTPMPTLNRNHVGSVITFEGQDFTITQIVDNRDPFSNDIWSYEVEVL